MNEKLTLHQSFFPEVPHQQDYLITSIFVRLLNPTLLCEAGGDPAHAYFIGEEPFRASFRAFLNRFVNPRRYLESAKVIVGLHFHTYFSMSIDRQYAAFLNLCVLYALDMVSTAKTY